MMMYGMTRQACVEPLSKLPESAYEDPLCSKAIFVWDHLACGTSITLGSCGWRFGNAIYQTTPLAVCLFRTKYLYSMTSSASQNGRDHCKRPTVYSQFVCSCHHLTESFSQEVLPSAKPSPRQNAVRRTHPGPRHVAAFAHTSRRYTWSGTHLHPGTSVTRCRQVLRGNGKRARSGQTRGSRMARNTNAHSCRRGTCDLRDCVCRVGNPLFFWCCSFALQGLLFCPSPGPKWVPLCLLRKTTSLGLLLVACWRRVCVDRGATGVNGFADTSVRTGPGPKLPTCFQGYAADEAHVGRARGFVDICGDGNRLWLIQRSIATLLLAAWRAGGIKMADVFLVRGRVDL